MKSRLLAGVLAAVTLALGAAAFGTSAANAAATGPEIGHLVFQPSKGSDLTAIKVMTTVPCPAKADAYFVKVYGHGFPKDGYVVTGNTDVSLSHSAPFQAYFGGLMRDYATDNDTTLGGTYEATLYCVDSFLLTDYGHQSGTFVYSTPKKFHAVGVAAQAPASANSSPTRAATAPSAGTGQPTASAPAGGSGVETAPIPTITAGAPSTAGAQPSTAAAANSGANSGSSKSSVLWAVVLVAVLGLVAAWVLRTWSTRTRR